MISIYFSQISAKFYADFHRFSQTSTPVRAGIVNNPEDYRYSSAISYADEKGLLEIIPVTFSEKIVS